MLVQILPALKDAKRLSRMRPGKGLHYRLAAALVITGLQAGSSRALPLNSSAGAETAADAGADSAWQEVGGTTVLCLSHDRLILTKPDGLEVLGLEHEGSDSWAVRRMGKLETWHVSRSAEALKTEVAGKPHEYRRLESQPSECDLKPFPLGPATPLPRERANAIAEEILVRMNRARVALKHSATGGPSPKPVIAENKEYVRGLLREVGWIDIPRFGVKASGNAVVLVKYSFDIPLLMAILPGVEKDLKTSPGGNFAYAALYDSLQIVLGRKQRYGSHLGTDSAGNPMVLPLENPARLDEIRKSIGITTMSQYLEALKASFPGKTIRMPRPDE